MNIDSVFRGIMATPITSFDAQGNLYPKGIENLVMFMKKGGIDCLYCLGTYGGFALMSKKERMEAAEIDVFVNCLLKLSVVDNTDLFSFN